MIPAIHKNILLFFVAVFFLGFLTFIALLEGFGIDRLTFGGVKIEKLYLKWENSLLIKAQRIDLRGYRSDDEPLNLQIIDDLPRYIRWGNAWIESVDIDTIESQDINLSLRYARNRAGTVTVRGGKTRCEANFTLNERTFALTLPSCSINEANTSATLRVDLLNQRLDALAQISLPNTPLLRLHAHGDSESLRFRAEAAKPFSTIRPLCDFLSLDPEVAPWVVEYAKAASLRLHRFEGVWRYDDPGALLEGIYASASVEKGEYTFAQGIEPIRSPRIDLVFEKGKLHILPQNGTFYTHPTEKSRLWIDFMTPNATLVALIRTDHARLDEPILNLLRFYGITLPLRQLSGQCAVDLNLTVNLATLDTTAKGTFAPTPSQLQIGSLDIQTSGGIVRLDTRLVSFEDFTARYGRDVAEARVSGRYDAADERGEVEIKTYSAAPLGDPGYLRLGDSPLMVRYRISPEGDTIEVQPSQWYTMGETLRVEGFSAPFDYAGMRLSLPKIGFSIPDRVRGKIAGRLDGSRQKSDIAVQFDHVNFHGSMLTHAPFRFTLAYDGKTFRLDAPEASSWSFNRLPVLISPFNASWAEEKLSFEGIESIVGDWFRGKMSGAYRTDARTGSLRLENLVPLNPKITPLINTQESLDLDITATDDTLRIDAPSLQARFLTIPQGWQIELDNISLLSRHSPLLRRYHLDNGFLRLYYTGERSQYRFNGSIRYPYPLLMVNDVPLSQYRFNGSYAEGSSTIRVNDRLTISQTPERIAIRANNAGINVPELFSFLSSFEEKGKNTASSDELPVYLYATHTYLHLMKGRKIVADTLSATMNAEGFNATLEHQSGKARLKIRDNAFIIDGQGFNDTFMNHLFSFGDVSGGAFSFEAKGEADRFEGIMRVENAVLKDYKVLNNVLAFVNTVPSLTTFSLPNYHARGLPLKEGYAHFAYRKGIVKVDNFLLNSPEIKISGEGKADTLSRTLEGAMTLKTDLGSKLGKVPMVGYILLGDDGSVSTTLTLSGNLDDPKVETSFAKEIVTAPFNILKRTVSYPFLWMIPDEKKK